MLSQSYVALLVFGLALPAMCLDPIRLPLVYLKDKVVTANIGVGSPAQQVKLMLDTTASDTLVIDQNCVTNQNMSCLTLADGYTRTPFIPKDPTVTDLGAHYKRIDSFVAYYDAFNAMSTIGGNSLKLNFGLVAYMANASWFDADGVLGLGPRLASPIGASVLQNYTQSVFNNTLVTIWLDDFATPNGKGSITVGGYNDRDCEMDDLVTYPSVSPLSWTVQFSGISMDSYSYAKSFLVQVDSTTENILVPQTILDGLIKTLNATFDSSTNSYFVPCSNDYMLPDLVLNRGTDQFNIIYREYAKAYTSQADRCQIMLGVNTNWEMYHYGPQVRLGHPWLRAYCNIFDYAAGNISFSEARHMQ